MVRDKLSSKRSRKLLKKLLRARRGMSYFDRNYEGWYSKPRKKVCPSCRITFARNKICPNCGTELVPISYRAKVPRKNASNGVWKRFWKKHNEWCGSNPYRRRCYGY